MNVRIVTISSPNVRLKYNDSNTLISIALLSEGNEPSCGGLTAIRI